MIGVQIAWQTQDVQKAHEVIQKINKAVDSCFADPKNAVELEWHFSILFQQLRQFYPAYMGRIVLLEASVTELRTYLAMNATQEQVDDAFNKFRVARSFLGSFEVIRSHTLRPLINTSQGPNQGQASQPRVSGVGFVASLIS